jgi:UDP-4-amino-4,6-dideoxy-N-acetyl-beta-L-altrosamine transaminase
MIPYGKQDISKEDIDEVLKVLRSDFLTQGPQVKNYEEAISSYCGASYASASNSATSSLHLACLALGLKKDDWLWTSPITFVASANCGLYCGAKVDFVDVDPLTYNMCAKALEIKLIEAKKLSKLPKIVIPVHLCGQPCDMKAIYKLSKEYGFKIIEDASHAIGGKYLGKPIGNCSYSDVTVFSFHPVKIITTGEGGMAVTNNFEVAKKIALLTSHGITRDANEMTHDPDGEWYYQQVDLGFNYRMTDIQAALGLSQLKRLDKYVSLRHKIADRYNQELKNLPILTPYQHNDGYSAFHLYVIRIKDTSRHKEIFKSMRMNGIGVNLHYIPVHLQPYYIENEVDYKNLNEAESYYREAISIPIYPIMKKDQQDTVISNLKNALNI